MKPEQEIIVYGWQQFMATVLQVGELKCQLHEQFLFALKRLQFEGERNIKIVVALVTETSSTGDFNS